MEGDDHDSALGLDVHVDDDQPAPWADESAAIPPYAKQLRAGSRELLQRAQRARNSLSRIGRKLTGFDYLAKLVTRQARDLNDRH